MTFPLLPKAARWRLGALLLAGASFGGAAWADLGINHAFDPSTIAVTQSTTLTVNLVNPNNTAATGTGVSVPLGGLIATNLQTSCAGGDVELSGGNLVLAGGTVPAGPAGTCTVTATVTAATARTYESVIPVGAVTSSHGSNTTESRVALTVTSLQPITGSKAFAVGTGLLRGGATTTVTITLNNSNDEALTNLAFTDKLPTGLKVASPANAVTTCGSGSVTATDGASSASLADGTIPPNGSCTVTFDVTPADPSKYSIDDVTNRLLAGSITAAGGVSNTSAISATVKVATGANINKSLGQENPVLNGTARTLTFEISNSNATNLTPITFTDNLPAGIVPTGIASNTCGGTPGFTANSVTLTGGNVAGGETCLLAVDYTATNTGSTYITVQNDESNFDTVVFGGIEANVAGATLTINPTGLGGISASKTFNTKQHLLPGRATVQTAIVNMVIELKNDGPRDAAIVNVTDDLKRMTPHPPPATDFDFFTVQGSPSTNCGGTVDVSADRTVITKTDGVIPAGGSCTITVPVRVGGHVPYNAHRTNYIGGTDNAVTVSIDGVTGSWGGRNWADLVVERALIPHKSFSPTTIYSGQTTSEMTIRLERRPGVTALTNVSFDDVFPTAPFALEAQRVVSNSCDGTVDLKGGTGVQLTGGVIPIPDGGQLFGSSCQLVVEVGAPARASGTVTNTLPLGAVTTAEHVRSNPEVRANITAVPASLGLSKQFTPSTLAAVGGTAKLTLILSNTEGAGTQTDVTLLDNLPAGMVVADPPNAALDAAASSAGCAIDAAHIIATAGASTIQLGGAGATLPQGGNCYIDVDVQGNALGNLNNVIPPLAMQSSIGLGNTGVAQAALLVSGSGDLGVTIDDGTDTVAAGGSTTYVVTVTNHGDTAVAGASLTNLAPAGVTYGAWTCTATGDAACPPNGSGDLNALAVTLPVGSSLRFEIPATLADPLGSPLTNTATIRMPSGVADTAPGNNTDTDVNTVVAAGSLGDVGVVISNPAPVLTPGSSTTYEVTVTNHGLTAVSNVGLSANAPASITYGNWTCTATGGAVCPAASGNGDIAETLALPVGGELVYSIAADVSPTATGPNITAEAAVTLANDTDLSNNTSSVSTPLGGMGGGGGGLTAIPVNTPGGLALLSLLVAGAGWLGRRQMRQRRKH